MDKVKLTGEAAKAKQHMKDVALIVGAMAICKGTIWYPGKKRYVGTVD